MRSCIEWISPEDAMPEDYVSVLAFAPCFDPFPVVREAYVVIRRSGERTERKWFFPAISEEWPVDENAVMLWAEMPVPPEMTDRKKFHT